MGAETPARFRWPGPRASLAVAVAAFAIEWWLFTAGRLSLGIFASPVLFYFAGVALCVAAHRHVQTAEPGGADPKGQSSVVAYAIVAAMLIVVTLQLAPIVFAEPLNPRVSDIYPTVQVYVGRFLSGETVYTLIRDFGYDIVPNYLPLHWLPFVIPDVLGVDYRWMSFAVFGIGHFAYAHVLAQMRRPLFETGIKALIPGVLTLSVIIGPERNMFAHTLEPMVIGFYYLAAAALLGRSVIARATALALPLLSRYTLILWLPLYLAIVAWRESWRRALLLAGLMALAVLAIYVVPFLVPDPSILARSQESYAHTAAGEWQRFSGIPGRTYHIHNGLGFAVFIYELVPGTIPERIDVTRLIHVIASLLAVAVAGAWYVLAKPRLDHRVFAIISLKLCVATFYFFIQVPYAYLTSLSLFLSAFVLLFITWPVSREVYGTRGRD